MPLVSVPCPPRPMLFHLSGNSSEMCSSLLDTSTKGRAAAEGEILEMGIRSFLMPGFTIRPGKRPKKSYLLVFARSCSRNASFLPTGTLPALLDLSPVVKPPTQDFKSLSSNLLRFQPLSSGAPIPTISPSLIPSPPHPILSQ